MRVEAGELNGFKIVASVRKGLNGFSYGLAVARERQYSRDDDYPLSEDIDPIGLMRRCEGLIKSIPKLLEARQSDLAKAEADLPRLQRQLTPPSFAKSDRLQSRSVLARLKRRSSLTRTSRKRLMRLSQAVAAKPEIHWRQRPLSMLPLLMRRARETSKIRLHGSNSSTRTGIKGRRDEGVDDRKSQEQQFYPYALRGSGNSRSRAS